MPPRPAQRRLPGRRELGERAASLGTSAADAWFRRSSPIPYLDRALLRAVMTEPVTLPPRTPWMMPGTQTVEGLLFLAGLARVLDVRQAWEIGTYNGLTTWTIAENAPSATVHTLDLAPEEEPDFVLEEGDHPNRRRFRQRLFEAVALAGEVVSHEGDSARFNFGPWRDSVQLVYVDGAHSEPYVRSDTARALEMLTAEGAIVWDDYWRDVQGVRTVLDERDDLDLARVPATRLVVHLTEGARRRLSDLGAAAPD